MKYVFTVLLATLVCSCTTAPAVSSRREPEAPLAKAPPQLEQELRAAEASARAGDNKRALARIKKLQPQLVGTELAADGNILAGSSYFALQQYNEALASYAAAMAVEGPRANEAQIRHSRTLIKLGKTEDAEEHLQGAYTWKNLTPEQSLEVDRLRVEALIALKRNAEALQLLVKLADRVPQPAEREKYRSMAQEFMDTRLTEDELKSLASSSSAGFLSGPAKFRYALLMADQRNYGRARALLSEAAELSPGSELAERATSLVQQIDARNRVDARTIGVVLPLSGKQAAVGYKALRAIQLGIGVYGTTKSNFRLAIVDSEGNPDSARRAVERLVQEDNVIALIGGLLSRTASAEAAKAQEFGVPTILLSQKAGVTQAGDSIFRNALTGEMQIQHIVDYAMNQLGYKNFAIMYPNDAYGTEYADLFWDEVKSRGGDITGAQPYDPKETDFRGHVQRLAGTFYLEDRSDEYRQRSKAYFEKNPNRSSRASAPSVEDILPPITDFDAIFIPDSARAVGQIAPMLAYNNVNKIRLLGTNLWNSPATVSRGQKYVENSIFVDSVLSTETSFRNSDFVKNFKATFDEEPGLTEVQAFDSAAILRQLIGSGESTRVGLQQRMASLQNFPGAIGSLSVNGNREIRRPMTSLTIKAGNIVPLETKQQ